jgi:ADP-ribose pyrophosphatase
MIDMPSYKTVSKLNKSIQLLESLLREKDTGHKVVVDSDTWEGVGPGSRIKVSPRNYRIITPEGRSIQETWTVVKQSDGVTIKPVLTEEQENFLVLLYKPHPAVGQWLLEFPSGGKKATETIEQTAARELEEETGYKAGGMNVIMRDMRFAPFRFEQNETVVEAKDLTEGKRKLEYEESVMEVHLVPEGMIADLLRYNIIKDFRTRAIAAEHLIGR